jgi:rhodanese-related sulfurtransferase
MSNFGAFSEKEKVAEIKEYLAKDAVVLDVRTEEEWDEGHTSSAEHIVLNFIPDEIETIKSWGKPVIAVCRSGARSQQATNFLTSNGVDVINGGPWQNVDQCI